MRNPEIIYSDDLPEWYGAYCKYSIIPLFGRCTITIRPKYVDDLGLLRHELKHVEQFSTCILHSFLYKFFDFYRYKCELEAYIEQIKEYKYNNINQADWIIQAIKTKYNLDSKYTVEKITNDLLKIIKEDV